MQLMQTWTRKKLETESVPSRETVEAIERCDHEVASQA